MTEPVSDASIVSEQASGTVIPRVELRGIRKSFGTTDALRGVDLHLAPGEVGPGLPEDVRKRLFRPFATGRTEGVGLGLALARRIVDLHGATLQDCVHHYFQQSDQFSAAVKLYGGRDANGRWRAGAIRRARTTRRP